MVDVGGVGLQFRCCGIRVGGCGGRRGFPKRPEIVHTAYGADEPAVGHVCQG